MIFSPRALALCAVAVVAFGASAGDSPEMIRVFAEPQVDARAVQVRTLYQGSGFQPFKDRGEWEKRAAYLRQQVLMASGLWPLPERCPLNAVIHSPIDRGDYTVEKVFFQSYPGFYVTGNLYRPKGKTGPFPVVLSPHGHWNNGRFYEAGDKDARKQIAGGFEKELTAARYPLQARCANLAKLGCVIFFYDMVGYADADPEHFPHRKTFRDVDSDQRSISVFGLQTWNSLRAMDFVLSLPNVDPNRTACTGASGGASQTIMLMSVDDRLKFAAPVCMISAGDHQGGCVCENNSLLRVGTDNVELAATFAPRPFIHPTATGDWTHAFMEHGYPEIKGTYTLFNADADFEAVRYSANHNYNLKSREAVYTFFNKHLKLRHTDPVVEERFEPVIPEELSVFDAAHPRPADSVDANGLKKYLIESTEKQLASMRPENVAVGLKMRSGMHEIVSHLLFTDQATTAVVAVQDVGGSEQPWGHLAKLIFARSDTGTKIPAIALSTRGPARGVTVLISGKGKSGILNADGTPGPLAAALLDRGQIVIAPDVFLTGELAGTRPAEKVDGKPVEFRAGYNRTIIGNRVQDILTAVASAQALHQDKPINLIGVDQAGPWCLLARPLTGETLAHLAADANHFDFAKITSVDDDNYLPGSLRYGGLWPLASVGPLGGGLFLFNTGAEKPDPWITSMMPNNRLKYDPTDVSPQAIVDWIRE